MDHHSVASGRMMFGRLASNIREVPPVYWLVSREALVQDVNEEATSNEYISFPAMVTLFAVPATTPKERLINGAIETC